MNNTLQIQFKNCQGSLPVDAGRSDEAQRQNGGGRLRHGTPVQPDAALEAGTASLRRANVSPSIASSTWGGGFTETSPRPFDLLRSGQCCAGENGKRARAPALQYRSPARFSQSTAALACVARGCRPSGQNRMSFTSNALKANSDLGTLRQSHGNGYAISVAFVPSSLAP